jgi:hypothetical protein
MMFFIAWSLVSYMIWNSISSTLVYSLEVEQVFLLTKIPTPVQSDTLPWSLGVSDWTGSNVLQFSYFM